MPQPSVVDSGDTALPVASAPPQASKPTHGRFPYSPFVHLNDPSSIPSDGWGEEDDTLRQHVLSWAQSVCQERYLRGGHFSPAVAARILNFGTPVLPVAPVDEGSDLSSSKTPFHSQASGTQFSELEHLAKRRNGIIDAPDRFPSSGYFASYFSNRTIRMEAVQMGTTSVYDNALSFPLTPPSRRGSRIPSLRSNRTKASAAAKRWNRYWIYTVDSDGHPTCAGGPPPAATPSDTPALPQEELYDVAFLEADGLEGPVSGAKVAADRVLYVGWGVSEVQFYIRQAAPRYRTCVDIRRSTGLRSGGGANVLLPSGRAVDDPVRLVPNGPASILGRILDETATTTALGAPLMPGILGAVTNTSVTAVDQCSGAHSGEFCHLCFQNYQLTCDEGGFAEAEEPVSSLPPCTAPPATYLSDRAYRGRFRYGGWVQMKDGVCDGYHCVVVSSQAAALAGAMETVKGLPRGLHPTANQDLRTAFRSSKDGWVWASDLCTMVIFGSVTDLLGRPEKEDSTRPLLTNRWIYGWGSSVMKQPLSNMIEYRLRKAIFALPGPNPDTAPEFPSLTEERDASSTPVFMAEIPKYLTTKGVPRKAVRKKLPGFFHYREWDRPMTFTGDGGWWSRFTMTWAGCTNIMGAPSGCASHAHQGMGGTFPKVASTISNSQGKATPDVMLLEFGVWRHPLFDEQKYLAQTAEMFARLKTVFTAKASDMPLLIYHTTPTPISQEGHRCSNGPRFPAANTKQHAASLDTSGIPSKLAHSVWAYEDVVGTGCVGPDVPPTCANLRATTPKAAADIEDIVGSGTNVVLVARFHLTYPFHFGSDFCHFGIHYGSTEGMCYTGYERKGYGLENCVRKTFVDEMLPEIWFNAIAAHEAGAVKK